MMRNPTKLISIAAALTAVGFYACSKYKDPPKADPVDTGSHYCNDSRAVNFNWGFPGIPDSTSCVFPVDSMLGSWVYTDSVFLPNGNLQGITIRNLSFAATEDSTLTHMAVSGWCTGSPVAITINKYGQAYVDTFNRRCCWPVALFGYRHDKRYLYKTGRHKRHPEHQRDDIRYYRDHLSPGCSFTAIAVQCCDDLLN